MRFIQQKHFFWPISLQGFDFEIAAVVTAAAAAAKHSCKQCKYTQNYISIFKLPKHKFYLKKQRFGDLQLYHKKNLYSDYLTMNITFSALMLCYGKWFAAAAAAAVAAAAISKS